MLNPLGRRDFLRMASMVIAGGMLGGRSRTFSTDLPQIGDAYMPIIESAHPLGSSPVWYPQVEGIPTLAYLNRDGEERAWWAADDDELAAMEKWFWATRSLGKPDVAMEDVFPVRRPEREEKLLRQIALRDETELEARLEYADLLSKRDDLQGEFIRLDCEVENGDPASEGYAELVAKRDAYCYEHAHHWLRPLAALGIWPSDGNQYNPIDWHRGGLVEFVGIRVPGVLPEKAQLLFQAYPTLRSIYIEFEGWNNPQAWRPPQLAQLEAMVLRYGFRNSATIADIEGLERARLDRLKWIWVRTNLSYFWPEVFERFCHSTIFPDPDIASAEDAPGLRNLMLSGGSLSAEHAQILADSPRMRWLSRLDIDGNPLGDSGVLSLLRSENMPHLKELNIDHTDCSDAIVDELLQFGFSHEGLDLQFYQNELTSEGRFRFVMGMQPPIVHVHRSFFNEDHLEKLKQHFGARLVIDDSDLG